VDKAQLAILARDPLFQQGLVLFLAVFAGLFVMTVAARLEISRGSAPARALAAYRTDVADTPLEKLGLAIMRRFPSVRNLLDIESHRRWLLLEGNPLSLPATVGLAFLFGLAGLGAMIASNMPALIMAPFLGFILPFVRQRSAAKKVRQRVLNTLPDISALLAAEMAAGNPPDTALARAANLGGPLARIIQIALGESRTSKRPLFGRGKTDSVLLEVAQRYDLSALHAFVAQVNMAASTGAAGPDLMQSLAHTLIVEYKDRALREAEALDSRLAVPSVLFFFLPFLFLMLAPLLLPVIQTL
jgi:Flp pilus assembly protein TadB